MQVSGVGYQTLNNHKQSVSPNFQGSFDGASSDRTMNMTVGVTGLGIISVMLSKLSGLVATMSSKVEEFTDPATVKKIANKMLKDSNLENVVEVAYIDDNNKGHYINRLGESVKNLIDDVAQGRNAFYSDSAKLATAPASRPSPILHELGHAINANCSKFMKALQNTRGVAVAIPTVLALLNGFFNNRADGEKSSIEKHAGIIGFGAFLPTIVEEAAASHKGIQAAKKVLGDAAKLGPLKKAYGLALGTYVLAGVGLGIASKQIIAE